MKKSIFGVAALMLVLLASCNSGTETTVWTLDLNNTTTSLSYDDDGLWSGLYSTAVDDFVAQTFTFHHRAAVSQYVFEGQTYETTYYMGYGVSKNNKADATLPESAITKGGLNGEGTPYMTCYWGDYYDATKGELNRTSDITFTGADSYKPQAVYLTNTAQVVSTLKNGGSYDARAFKDGDYLLLTVKALNENNEVVEGNEVKYYLADFRDGKTFINEEWAKIDLTPLGVCFGITFTMESTDKNEYGFLTPTYFALDGLTVIPQWAK
ncbi:MAG: DUF4465 domain-containing protein [Paludibacteraceae bacterium]|nr:DUF4465 domain-containing protein [Paludibacteraceae bacterium]